MPSSFTAPLTVTKLGKSWRVSRSFRYYIAHENSHDYIEVPENFETDFASVPRGLWNIFPPDGEYTQAAVLHDYLYNTKLRTRSESDRIFLEAMTVLLVPAWKRQLMYRAVRLFGWIPWKKRR